MKNKITRIVAVLLIATLIISVFPMGALADLKPTEGEITGNSVAFRDGPSTSSNVVMRLTKGTIVKIQSTNVNAQWHKVTCKGKTGYVNRMYVDFDRSIHDTSYTGSVANVEEFVNIRKDATTSAAVLGKAKLGETFPVVDASAADGWHKITYKKQDAYVSSRYVSLTAKADKNQLTSLKVSGGSMAPKFSPSEYGYMVTTQNDSVTIKATANKGVKLTMNDEAVNSLSVTLPESGIKTVRIKLDGKVRYTIYIMRNVLTVGTWNIKRGYSQLLSQGRVIRDALPDIVGLQEVLVNKKNSNKIVDNLASLRTKWMQNYRFTKTINVSAGDYGHGVLTHYEILSHDVYLLPSAGKEQRMFSKTVMKIGSRVLSFYNAHLSYDSKAIRKPQFAKIAEAMKNDPNDYKILVGDFNADFAEFSQLGNYTVINTPNTKYYDYYGKEINLNEIDNIIVSKNIKVVNTRMVRTKASDHCPVFAYLTLS